MLRRRHSRHIQRLAHGVEVEPDNPGRESHRRYTSPLCQSTDRRLANLENFGELLRGEKLFALRHKILECAGVGIPREHLAWGAVDGAAVSEPGAVATGSTFTLRFDPVATAPGNDTALPVSSRRAPKTYFGVFL